MGYFLLLLVIGFFVYAFVKAKARRHFARQAGALRAVAAGPTDTPPSWITNKDRMEEFFHAMISMGVKNGVPESFVVYELNTADELRVIMELAGNMEERGASFTEQQAAMSQLIFKLWERQNDHNKRVFTQTTLQRK